MARGLVRGYWLVLGTGLVFSLIGLVRGLGDTSAPLAWICGGLFLALSVFVALSSPRDLVGLGWPLWSRWPDQPTRLDVDAALPPVLAMDHVDRVEAGASLALDLRAMRLEVGGLEVDDGWGGLRVERAEADGYTIEPLARGAGYRSAAARHPVPVAEGARHAFLWALWRVCTARGWRLEVDGVPLGTQLEVDALERSRAELSQAGDPVGATIPLAPGARAPCRGPDLYRLAVLSPLGGITLPLAPLFWLLMWIDDRWPAPTGGVLRLGGRTVEARGADVPMSVAAESWIHGDASGDRGVLLLGDYALSVGGELERRRAFLAGVLDRAMAPSAGEPTDVSDSSPAEGPWWVAPLLGRLGAALFLSVPFTIPVASAMIQHAGLRDIGWAEFPVAVGTGFAVASLAIDMFVANYLDDLGEAARSRRDWIAASCASLAMFGAKILSGVGVLLYLYQTGVVKVAGAGVTKLW